MVNHGQRRRVAVALAAVAALVAAFVPAASADNGTDTRALRDAVTVEGVLAHEQAFQQIADANGGTRAAGTSGYEASGVYVEDLLDDAGYVVRRQEFTYEQFILDGSTMAQTAPGSISYVEDQDFAAMTYSGSGDVTAPVQVVDINLAGDRASTSGCEAGDFAGFPAGHIALIQRGTCTFRIKVDNAAAAGASAVIVFNQGNVVPGDDRVGLFFGTLDPPMVAIPGREHHLRPRRGARHHARAGDARRRRRHGRVDHDVQRPRRHPRRADRPHGGRRRPPGLGGRGPRHQRQRQRLGGHPGDRAADGRARHRAARTGCVSPSGAARRTA